jgi:folate-binding protein YgfZ
MHASAVAALIPSPLADPRHLELPVRNYLSPDSCHLSPIGLGIPELGRDFAPDEVTAMDAGYDLLHAISFTKGCYVGQEVTARMHYKNIARKGFFILAHDTMPARLALLKFEEAFSNGVAPATGHPSPVTLDGITYRAALPTWMQPKLVQFQNSAKNQ